MQQPRTYNGNNNAHRDAWSVWEYVWSSPDSRHRSRRTHTTTPAAVNERPSYYVPYNNNANNNAPEYPSPWEIIVGVLYQLYFLYIWYYYAPSGAFFEFLWSIVRVAFKVSLVGVLGYLSFQLCHFLMIPVLRDPNEPSPPPHQ
ncbi:hypothetical protein BKA57DRAFT_476335 [Linnemannia elongata]|nr:hypothetical protein BKA57DRAFT_476335 [Linnemannia elongata]